MKRLFFPLAVVLLGAVMLPAQMVVSSLASPVFAGGDGGTTSQEAPFSTRFNPASAAHKQRTTFDTSYFGLPGGGKYGNAFNLGLTVPQNWAVLSMTASYWGVDVTGLDLGHQGQFSFGLSKEFVEDLHIGAQMGTVFGTGGWGAGLSLGFLHFPGTLNPWLQDLRWGVALRDMGTPYTTGTSKVAIPPIFTPSVGASFYVLKQPLISIEVHPDLSLPSFQDIRLGVGSTVKIGENFVLSLAGTFDLRDTITAVTAKTALTFPLSMSLAYHFQTNFQDDIELLDFSKQGWNKSEVHVNTAVMPLPGGVWAVGGGVNIPLGSVDTQAPVVTLDAKQTFISPNNDGVQDALEIPVKMTDQRFISSYRVQVFNVNKFVVRSIQSSLALPQAEGWDQILNRLLYVKHGVAVPPALTWNGISDAGTVVPDGTYTVVVTARDDNGNEKDWPAGSVVVKNTPPLANLSAAVSEFNPVGPRDKLTLRQSGTPEDLWTGVVRNSRDEEVLRQTWKNTQPPNFDWDGKNNEGKVVSDGVYTYELSTTDLAGNKANAKVTNLIVNSLPTPLDLFLNRTAISPDGSGVKTLAFQPKPGLSAGMTSWKIDVLDGKNNVYRTLAGQGLVPPEITFDGRAENRTALPEGDYKGRLTLTYSNGNKPEVVSPVFTIKNSAPTASVTAPYDVFSPGSVEGRGVLVFQQTTSDEELWTGKLTSASGDVLRTVRWFFPTAPTAIRSKPSIKPATKGKAAPSKSPSTPKSGRCSSPPTATPCLPTRVASTARCAFCRR